MASPQAHAVLMQLQSPHRWGRGQSSSEPSSDKAKVKLIWRQKGASSEMYGGFPRPQRVEHIVTGRNLPAYSYPPFVTRCSVSSQLWETQLCSMPQLKPSLGLLILRSISMAFVSCSPLQTVSSRLCVCACLPLRFNLSLNGSTFLLCLVAQIHHHIIFMFSVGAFPVWVLSALSKVLYPEFSSPFHWCCFLWSTSSLAFGLVMTQAHCMTAAPLWEEWVQSSHSSALPAWKCCHFSTPSNCQWCSW